MKKKCVILAFSLVVLNLIACSSNNVVTKKEEPEISDTVASDEAIGDLVTASDTFDFYHNTFDYYMTNLDTNFIYSPYSEKLALTGVLLGTDTSSTTYKELSTVIGVSEINLDSALANIKSDYMRISQIDDLSITNSIWFQEDIKSSKFDKFCADVNNCIGLDCFSEDLTSQSFVSNCNQYVEKATNGKIKDLIKSPLSDYTKCMLVNTLYLDSKWVIPFNESETSKDLFNKNMVDFMHNTDDFSYAVKGDLELLKLPYTNDTEMILINSKTGADVRKSWGDLSVTHQRGMLDGSYVSFSKETVNLALPKFHVDSDISIKTSLQGLGVDKLFKEFSNSLPNIADDLYVSDILQTISMDCDESGTEAAVATRVTIETDSMALPSNDIINFIVDSPFIFVIKDNSTGEYLLMGYITEL